MNPRERFAARGSWPIGCALLLSLFAIYNANAREIPTTDSQPTKLLALAIVTSRSMTLDAAVELYAGAC